MLPEPVQLIRALTLFLAPLAASAHSGVLHVPRDHLTIQSAVYAAAPGDQIRIAAGDYPEWVSINDKSDLKLVGEPGTSMTRVSIFSSQQIQVRGIAFPSGPYLAIQVYTSSDVTIDGCETSGTTFALISTFSDRTRILRSAFRDTQVGVMIEFGSGHEIRQCRFERTSSDGITVRGADGVLIEKNRARSATDFWVTASSNVLIRKNRLKETAVSVGGSQGLEVVGNRIDRPRLPGVTVHTGSLASVRNNRISGGTSQGIWLQDVTDSLIRKNVVQGCARAGIQIEGSGNGFVRNRARNNLLFDLDDRSPGLNSYKRNRFGTTNLSQ